MTERDGVDLIVEQWRRERPDLDPTPMEIVGRISRLSRELERRLAPVFAGRGLEPGWFDMLAALRRSGPPYQLRPGELADSLMITSSAATKRLDRLEGAGLITREPDPRDRRGVLISLTAAGRHVVDEAVEAHIANEHDLLNGLSAIEHRRLANLLRKLQRALPAEST